MVSSDFCAHSYHFVCVCFFFLSNIWQLSKNSLFQKRVQKLGFFNFLCFKFKIWKFSFFSGLLKHYKNRVSANFGVFCCWKRIKAKKIDNWNFWIRVHLVQKWPFRDAKTFFSKKIGWNPYFYSVLGVRVFWAKLSKKAIFWTPPQKKRKFWLITEKLIFFWYFCVVLLFLSFFVCFFFVFCFFLFFCVFFWGFKGQVRWPEGPLHWP